MLHDHTLHGKYATYRSINVTGDIRIAYKKTGSLILLIDIGTHHELYGN